jgi:RHS repeat-associated protein
MTHNARNQRVRAKVGSVATELVFNAQGQRTSVWNGTTKTVLRGQYYGGGQPVADDSGGQTHFQHQDWLRTERLRTTYNGSVESTFTSLPFGDAQTTDAGGDPNYFAALDDDAETGTDHAQFRQYNSTQGHWMRPDPYYRSYDFSNPQTFNRYAYALNNPLSAVDPKGLECVWDDGSYDAADDPDTGCPDQCSNAGGTWVDPEIFENYLLTNGQPPNIPYGSWSDQPDPTLVSSWLTASATLDIFDAEPAVASMLQDFQNIGFYAGQPDFTPLDVFN